MALLNKRLCCTKVSAQIFTTAVTQWRNNTLWATKRKKKTAVDTAVAYFDNIYGSVYGDKWPSIRLALLSPHKYCAVVNNYGDTEAVCSQLQNEGAINIREMFDVHKTALLKKKRKNNRKSDQKRVYDVDKKMQDFAAQQLDEELDKFYPSDMEKPNMDMLLGKKRITTEQEAEQKDLIKQAKSSLEKSLEEASIDMNRQIDPTEGLSSYRLKEFIPVSKLKGREDYVFESDHFSVYNEPKDFPVTVEPELNFVFPTHLQIYAFDQGNLSRFQPSKSGSTGVLGYYLMDASSILPVLALGLSPEDKVLDMCAAPGGKSLLCLQTLYPDLVVCNDSSLSRLNRLQSVMREYFYDWKNKVTISNTCGMEIEDLDTYSKILVDVPCTTDRLSATEDDNNIFKTSRNRERILLPQLQVDLLFKALRLVKQGGTVVYSTCSLNPAQNDGVVHMALRKVWEETSMKIVVKDLRSVLEPVEVMFKFAEPECLRYGSLVVPYLPSNFGPMYFCKLEKHE